MESDLEILIHAARRGDVEGLKSCLLAELLNAEGPLGMTALGEACRAGQIDVVRFLLDAGASMGDVLHLACEYKGVDMVNVLMASGVSVDSVNKYGKTPLHTAVERNNVDIVEALLKHGASVDQVDRQRCQSPLHVACRTECVGIVKLLIAFGAQINLKNTSSDTPLLIACTWNKSLDVVLTLLNDGALIDEVDKFGDTALHKACDRGRLDMVRILLQYGASVNIPNKRHLTPLHLAFDYDSITSVLLDYGCGSGKCTLYSCPCNTNVLMCYYEHYCTGYNLDMYEKYFIKVKIAGIQYATKHHWKRVDFARWAQLERDSFVASCLTEVEEMKTREIGETACTYYNLLCRKKSALRNDKIIGCLSPEALRDFPIYGDMIYCSYLKIPDCLRRLDLMEKCSSFFELAQFAPLPLELAPLILEYLSDADLGHLNEICATNGIQSCLVKSPKGYDVAKILNRPFSKCSIT